MSDFDKLMARNKALAVPEAAGRPEGLTLDHMRRCFFGGYTDLDAAPDARIYKEVQDVAGLITSMEAYLTDHNGVYGIIELTRAVFHSRSCRQLHPRALII